MCSKLKTIGTVKEGLPTVLFIPGGTGCSPAVYDGIEKEIPWQSIQVDWSKSPGPWDIMELGNRVAELIKEAEIPCAIVAGYSAGGVIAQQAAIHDHGTQKRIKGLLLSNTGPCTIGHGDPHLPDRLKEHWFSESFFKEFMKRCFSQEPSPELSNTMLDYAREVPVEVVYQAAKTLRELDLRPNLDKITCPVIIAHGQLDQTRTREHVKMLTDGIPQAEVFWLDGGHTIMVEDRDGWIRALKYLIEKIH